MRSARKDTAGKLAGFTLIELLVATVLLGVALLALAPLFVRANRDVREGALRSTAAVFAQNSLESWAPSAGELESEPRLEYYSQLRRAWVSSEPDPPDRAVWARRTTVLRYPLDAVQDGRIDRVEALEGNEAEPGLRLLSIRVTVSRPSDARPIADLVRWAWIVE